MKTYNGKAIEDEKRPFGLGDAIASIATPIARVLKLNCIDKETKQLKPESRCQKWKDGLNNLKLDRSAVKSLADKMSGKKSVTLRVKIKNAFPPKGNSL